MSINCLARDEALMTPVRQVGAGRRAGQLLPASLQLGQTVGRATSLPARVQLARSGNNTSQLLAVKRYSLAGLLDSHSSEEDPTPHIQQEVAAMKQFQHPHLLSCLACWVVGSEVWLVSPAQPLGSLDQLLAVHHPAGLPELAITLVVRDLCHALHYLHSQGVVHRAVRASHLLLAESGSVVLTGLRHATPLHSTGEARPNLYSFPLHGAAANLPWLAPEILQQNLLGYNETSDMYSLAVTVCELGNGVVPFSEMPATLLMVEKLRGACPTLLDRTTDPGSEKDFSAALHQLVSACSDLENDRRPSARDLLHHPAIKPVRKSGVSLAALLDHPAPLTLHTGGEGEAEERGVDVVPRQGDFIHWSF